MNKLEFAVKIPDLNCSHGAEQEALLFPNEIVFASRNCEFLEKENGTHKACVSANKCGAFFCENVPAESRKEIAEALKNSFLLLMTSAIGGEH